jgi:acetyl-CoA C-acetyltransferase
MCSLEGQRLDFYEIHEAFASQVLCTLKALEDPLYCRVRLGLEEPLSPIRSRKAERPRRPDRSPVGATGGRIIAGLAKTLAENENGDRSSRALISICAAGGLGVTAILEKR